MNDTMDYRSCLVRLVSIPVVHSTGLTPNTRLPHRPGGVLQMVSEHGDRIFASSSLKRMMSMVKGMMVNDNDIILMSVTC